MPDPGEPHAPDPDDYESVADYLDAIDLFTRQRLTPEEMKIRRESIMGMIKLERLLEYEAEKDHE